MQVENGSSSPIGCIRLQGFSPEELAGDVMNRWVEEDFNNGWWFEIYYWDYRNGLDQGLRLPQEGEAPVVTKELD